MHIHAYQHTHTYQHTHHTKHAHYTNHPQKKITIELYNTQILTCRADQIVGGTLLHADVFQESLKWKIHTSIHTHIRSVP